MPSPTSIPEGIRAGLNAGATDIARGVAVRRIIGIQAGLPATVDDTLWGVIRALKKRRAIESEEETAEG